MEFKNLWNETKVKNEQNGIIRNMVKLITIYSFFQHHLLKKFKQKNKNYLAIQFTTNEKI